jgi:hypothetical protein
MLQALDHYKAAKASVQWMGCVSTVHGTGVTHGDLKPDAGVLQSGMVSLGDYSLGLWLLLACKEIVEVLESSSSSSVKAWLQRPPGRAGLTVLLDSSSCPVELPEPLCFMLLDPDSLYGTPFL